MKRFENLVMAFDDTIASPSYLRDHNLWGKSTKPEMASAFQVAGGFSLTTANTKLFGSRNHGPDFRCAEETVAGANLWETALIESYSGIKDECSESMATSGYLNIPSNTVAAPYGDNMFAAELNVDAIAKADAGVGAYTSQFAYNTNDAISADYFGIHAAAASSAEPISDTASENWGRLTFPLELGLVHRHSFPEVGSAKLSSPDKDFIEQLNNGLYDLSRLCSSTVVAPSFPSPSISSLPGNYTVHQRRSFTEDLDRSSPDSLASWRGMIDLNAECGVDHDCGHESCSAKDHHDAIPLACISAQERWSLYVKSNGAMQEPQESMVCTHCEVNFDSLEKYLEHLDAEKVKHENFCPDPTCPFSAIGFRFRWLLRRHICNHHLKVYNNDNAKKHSIKTPEKLLKEFLRHVYVCDEPKCLRAFYRLDSLLRHMRLIHGLLKKPFRKDRSGK